MHTKHRIIIADSRRMDAIDDQSVDLAVTSPPYPMIRMWDGLFSSLSPAVKDSLSRNDGVSAFDAMHIELDKVWKELYRVLRPGAFACVNIGDATRTIGNDFRLYSNHSRTVSSFCAAGFDCLPLILWRKQTNAPNKFMGSGMLPSGAYVTLEHEYILVFRKGSKREFKTSSQKAARMKSAFFWEERNKWFSDMWDFKGTPQSLNNANLRDRSASYPLELAFRLVNMYSLYEDTVLDPFMGMGTTALASIACGRNSIGIEIDSAFSPLIISQAMSFKPVADELLASRISAHKTFAASRGKSHSTIKYINKTYGYPVVTRQETGIVHYKILDISKKNDSEINVNYEPLC